VAGQTGRLVIVDTEMGRVLGGAQTCLLRLVPELTRRGWSVTVACEPPDPPFASDLRAAGVEVSTAACRYPRIVDDSARRLARWVNEQRPAAYVLSVSSGSGWAAMPLLHPDIPTLAVIHSDDETFYRPLRHYREVTDLAVAVSEPIYGCLTSTLDIHPSRASFAPYGVEKRTLRNPRKGPLRVAFVGRLSEQDKQISILAEAITRLRSAPIDFVVAGDGPDAAMFRQLLGRGHRAHLLGHISPEASLAAIQASDCLVLTSTGREGMPLTVLEARSCGVVPVLSDIPAHAALVDHGIDGLLVRAGDADALATALRGLAEDDHRLHAISRMSHRRAEQTTVGVMAGAYERAIDQAHVVRRGMERRPAVPLMPSCVSRWPRPMRKLRATASKLAHVPSRRAVS